MKPANTKQTFSNMEAGTARHCPLIDFQQDFMYNMNI